MQTGIVRTADGLLLPGFGPLAMFKILVEAALSQETGKQQVRVERTIGDYGGLLSREDYWAEK